MMPDMYENNDDVPVEYETRTDAEIMIHIMTMREQYGAYMTKGAAS